MGGSGVPDGRRGERRGLVLLDGKAGEGAIASRARTLFLTALCISLLLPTATAATTESPGRFAVRVKTAESRRDWDRLWELMHPRQRVFIPRALFVRCMKRIHSPRPRSMRVVSFSRALGTVAGVRGAEAMVTTVRLEVEYARAAPSQRVAVREVRVAGTWFWINRAWSTRAFIRINFCS